MRESRELKRIKMQEGRRRRLKGMTYRFRRGPNEGSTRLVSIILFLRFAGRRFPRLEIRKDESFGAFEGGGGGEGG